MYLQPAKVYDGVQIINGHGRHLNSYTHYPTIKQVSHNNNREYQDSNYSPRWGYNKQNVQFPDLYTLGSMAVCQVYTHTAVYTLIIRNVSQDTCTAAMNSPKTQLWTHPTLHTCTHSGCFLKQRLHHNQCDRGSCERRQDRSGTKLVPQVNLVADL